MSKKTKGSPSEGRHPRKSDRDEKDSREQPRPRLPLFSGGDPTLAERFEEELYKRKDG